MKFKYILLDAFTRTPFAGAQIAVFPHAEAITEAQRILLAREMNLGETVFIVRDKANSQPAVDKIRIDAELEIFTPQGRSGFAGQAILAAGYALGESGEIKGSDARVKLNDQTFDIVLGVKNQKVQISMPVKDHYDEYVPSIAELAQLIGLEQKHIGYQGYKAMIVGNSEPYLIVPVKNNDALREAVFNENKWQTSFVSPLAKKILLFSGEHPYESINFSARIVGKGVAVHEDPPIGAAAPAFGLFLAYGKPDYHRSCLVQRGDANSRESILEVNVDKKGQDVMALQLGGHVVKMGEGYFDLLNG